MRLKIREFVGAALLTMAGAQVAQAQPIADPMGAGLAIVVGSTDPVIATYLGTSAAFTDLLYFETPGGGEQFLFNNQTSLEGSTVNLGSFAVGTELVFRLASPEGSFFSGAASRNPDGFAHAAVQNDYGAPGTTLVSFEDLYGGPFEFNDLSFSFSGTSAAAVPEPGTWALMVLGAGIVGSALRTRRRRALAPS